MPALSDLLSAHTSFDDAQVNHVQRLVGEWQLLADLSFSDLLVWVPIADDAFLCVAQCRPTTGPTAYLNDQVGTNGYVRPASEWRQARTLEDAVANLPPGQRLPLYSA